MRSRQPLSLGNDATEAEGFMAVYEMVGTALRVRHVKETAAEWPVSNVKTLMVWRDKNLPGGGGKPEETVHVES